MKKRTPHPHRAEVEKLGYKGVLKTYSSYAKASQDLGVTAQCLYNWAPAPPDAVHRYRAQNLAKNQARCPPDPGFPDLPPRAALCLRKILGLIKESGGRPPTLRELALALGITSTNGVNDHLKLLTRQGYLQKSDRYKSCGYRLTDKAIPPVPREDIEALVRRVLYFESDTAYAESARRVGAWLSGNVGGV